MPVYVKGENGNALRMNVNHPSAMTAISVSMKMGAIYASARMQPGCAVNEPVKMPSVWKASCIRWMVDVLSACVTTIAGSVTTIANTEMLKAVRTVKSSALRTDRNASAMMMDG